MHDTPSTRVGIVRPTHASQSPIVAEIEARVLRVELQRRVGPIVLDLRVDGHAIGPWQPRAHAAWPGGIDVELDAAPLWSAGAPLAALFARTIEPPAAEVRARMLAHLRLVPADAYELDADHLASLVAIQIRPTDLWLIARGATSVATGDPAIDALATPPTASGIGELDAALDAAAATVTPTVASAATVANLVAELAAVRAQVAELEAEQRRTVAETTDRLDAVLRERAVLLERIERADLDRASLDRAGAA